MILQQALCPLDIFLQVRHIFTITEISRDLIDGCGVGIRQFDGLATALRQLAEEAQHIQLAIGPDGIGLTKHHVACLIVLDIGTILL